jgi:hypothetical protein
LALFVSGLSQYAAHPSMSRRALFEHIAALWLIMDADG